MATYDFRTARLRATKMMPYLTKAIMSTIPIEKPGIGTMATDCYLRIYYDPKVFDMWTLDQSSGVILHEMMHCISRHDIRAKARIGEKPSEENRFKWNMAADIAINQMLKEANVVLPDGCLHPDQFGFAKNLSTEEYYDLVQKLPTKKIPCNLLGEGTGEGSGSIADGVAREYEEGKPGGKKEDGSDTAHGLGDYERKRLDRVVANDISDAARKCGNMPGGLKRIADGILKPVFDPRREILAEVKYALNCTKGFGGSTWTMPNRRTPPNGLRLPKNVAPIPKVVLIFDTSGSMNQSDLALCRGVLSDVFKSLPCQDGVRVITGDTHMGSCQKAFSHSNVELVGGGGTDMGAIMEFASKTYPECNPIIVVTDGYTPWPSSALPQKCLALLTQKSERASVPQWIRTVYIRPEGDNQ